MIPNNIDLEILLEKIASLSRKCQSEKAVAT